MFKRLLSSINLLFFSFYFSLSNVLFENVNSEKIFISAHYIDKLEENPDVIWYQLYENDFFVIQTRRFSENVRDKIKNKFESCFNKIKLIIENDNYSWIINLSDLKKEDNFEIVIDDKNIFLRPFKYDEIKDENGISQVKYYLYDIEDPIHKSQSEPKNQSEAKIDVIYKFICRSKSKRHKNLYLD